MLEQTLDLITLGRVGVDLYPLQDGLPVKDVTSFGKYLGGSPANVAVAAARLGLSAAIITRTGDDPFQHFVVQELERLGVRTTWVQPVVGARTTLAFCEMLGADDAPLFFYRDDPPPEMTLTSGDLDLDAIERAGILWITASGLAVESSRDAHHAALDARTAGLTVLDLDHRPGFWLDEREAHREIGHALAKVDVAIGNERECELALGAMGDADAHAQALLDRGVQLAVVKSGARGALARTADERVAVTPPRVAVLNGLGAGDAFGGALAKTLREGWALSRAMSFASAAGAIVASRRECSTAMPTTSEVEALLATEAPHLT